MVTSRHYAEWIYLGVGAGLAIERGQGWLQVKRASPMPPFAYVTAKIAMAMLFSLIVVLILLGLGWLLAACIWPSRTQPRWWGS